MSLTDLVAPFIPLVLGAIGVLLMFSVTLMLYRRFLKKPIAAETKQTFLNAADDDEFVDPLRQTKLWTELSGETAGQIQLAV